MGETYELTDGQQKVSGIFIEEFVKQLVVCASILIERELV